MACLGTDITNIHKREEPAGTGTSDHRFGVSVRKRSKEMGEESGEETKGLGDLHKPTQLRGNSTEIFQLLEINFTLCNFCSKSQKKQCFSERKNTQQVHLVSRYFCCL